VPSDHAELSSLASALDDLTLRITVLADRHHNTPTEDIAADLYEVERALRTAGRRLSKLVRDLS
jgi:hypothetical protein